MRKENQNLSPFKFLAAFEAKDSDAFWGRNNEIDKLYELLLATNLVMIYGPSGIGKTSLIQCGLSKKFSGPDWIPLFIRRGKNFHESLLSKLQLISKISSEEKFDTLEVAVDAHLTVIDNKYHRPVYLFFDQFEEIFTVDEKDRGNAIEELKKLFQTLEKLRKNSTCKIVIIIREEFLGQLYDYEQYLSYLFDFRLRVEPMNKTKVNEVVTETFRKFDISCEDPKLPLTISDKLVEGKANAQLSYLQVYLDNIWNDAFKKKYPNFDDNFDELKIEISQDNLDAVGSIDNVLETHVETVIKNIADDKIIAVTIEKIRTLLDLFVTEEGTKKPLTQGTLLDQSKALVKENELELLLEKLSDFRLIREDNNYYELAHDALAKIIDSKRTGTQLLVKNLKASIDFSMERNARLDDVIIKNYDDLIKQGIDLNLEQGKIKYINESKNYRRNQKWLFRLLFVSLLMITTAMVFLYFNSKEQEKKAIINLEKAESNLKKYNQEKAKESLNDAKTYQKSGDIEESYYKIMEADSLNPNNAEIKALRKTIEQQKNIFKK